MRLTAQEARELVGPTPQDHVDLVYPMIREQAEKGKRFLRLGMGFWADEGYKPTKNYKEACEILRKDGYVVKFYYQEHQFVDMAQKLAGDKFTLACRLLEQDGYRVQFYSQSELGIIISHTIISW